MNKIKRFVFKGEIFLSNKTKLRPIFMHSNYLNKDHTHPCQSKIWEYKCHLFFNEPTLGLGHLGHWVSPPFIEDPKIVFE